MYFYTSEWHYKVKKIIIKLEHVVKSVLACICRIINCFSANKLGVNEFYSNEDVCWAISNRLRWAVRAPIRQPLLSNYIYRVDHVNRRYLLWKKLVWQSCKNVDAYQTWSWQLIYNILKIVTENKPNYYKLKMVLLFLREILDIIYVVVCHIAVSKIISQRALLLYWFRFFVMLRAVSWIQHFVRLIHK